MATVAETDYIISSSGPRCSGNSKTGGLKKQQSFNIGTKPTLVEKGPMRFLIMDAPRQATLSQYVQDMKKHNVSHLVRVCEPTYLPGSEFTSAGIGLHEMEFKDGTPPSKELITGWLKLVESTCFTKAASVKNHKNEKSGGPCIAVHCVAGLGRAPVMVAIALIEFAGMDPLEAVSFLRLKRRGAINEKQHMYLSGYKRSLVGVGGAGVVDTPCTCVIL